jgi:hypothetical protein
LKPKFEKQHTCTLVNKKEENGSKTIKGNANEPLCSLKTELEEVTMMVLLPHPTQSPLFPINIKRTKGK